MPLKVVGAGVGRTGTHSLKLALEQLLGGRCHHMVEIIDDPAQASGWTDAVDGREVDWQELLSGYVAQVDWPGASFWREISAANPEALVLLSTREPDAWYRSASNTIFKPIASAPPGLEQWFGTTLHKMFEERFSDDLENPTKMMEAFERHNAEVRAGVPADRLLEWTVSDGWGPICERLGGFSETRQPACPCGIASVGVGPVPHVSADPTPADDGDPEEPGDNGDDRPGEGR